MNEMPAAKELHPSLAREIIDWACSDSKIGNKIGFLMEGHPASTFRSAAQMDETFRFARHTGNVTAVSVIEDMRRLKADSLCHLLVAFSKSQVVNPATLRVLDRYLLRPVLGKGSFLHRLIFASEKRPVIGFFHRGWQAREAAAWHKLRLDVDETPLGLVSINLEEPDHGGLQLIFRNVPLPAVIVFSPGMPLPFSPTFGGTSKS